MAESRGRGADPPAASAELAAGALVMLELTNIAKKFGPQIALDSVSVRFERGEVVGIVGENGAGKSTLLNIISGIVKADSGSVSLDGTDIHPKGYKEANLLGIWRVFQDPALILGLPLYENVFLGHERHFVTAGFLDRREMARQAQRIVGEMGLDIDVREPTYRFNYSLRQAVEVAKAGSVSAVLGIGRAFLLMDEPTTGLTQVEVDHLLGLVRRLAKRHVAVVFVSHRLGEVLEICGRIYVLKDGRLVAETHADTTNESDLHEFMVGRVRDSDYYAEHRQTRDRSTKVVMEVQALTKRDVLRAHGSEGRRFAVENVSLSLHEGEILGVGGLVGSGKSILARCLAGVERLESGEMKVEGKVVRQPSARRMKLLGVAYLPPDRRIEGAVMSFPVSWNISLPSGERGSMGFATLGGFWRKTFERREAYRLINAFRIKAGPQNQTQTLSGGNQQKVVLAKWIRRNPRILIMDNPTSGIDVGARMEIYAILRDLATGGAGIVLVSDDLSELIALSDRVAVMRNGRLARVFDTPDGDKPSEAALVSMMTAGQEGGAQAGEQKLEHHA